MTRFVFAAVLFTAFTSTLVEGQSIKLKATIPFEFRVGPTAMPAGNYVIQCAASGPVIVKEQSGSHAAMAALTEGEIRFTPLQTGELEFNRYGETYFLAKLWTPGSREGIVLPKSPREKEISREFGLAQRTSVALQRK